MDIKKLYTEFILKLKFNSSRTYRTYKALVGSKIWSVCINLIQLQHSKITRDFDPLHSKSFTFNFHRVIASTLPL